MNFDAILAEIRQEKCVGFRYQREGHTKYRDRVTVYRDGRLLFERFCWGEAAGLVFKLWADSVDENGAPQWSEAGCCVTGAAEEAPQRLTGASENGIFFDGKNALWECVDKLRNDKANGYGGLWNSVLGKLQGR